MILYELLIKFPESVEILEHEVDEFGKLINGEKCMLNKAMAQNVVRSQFGSLLDPLCNFNIGIHGFFDQNAVFHDMRCNGSTGWTDFKDEIHFYSYKKQDCLAVLKQFYKLLGQHNKKISEMRRNISKFRKEDKDE